MRDSSRLRDAPARPATALRSARNDKKAGTSAGIAEAVIDSARSLREAVEKLRFGPPVTHIYNPLDYAWAAHDTYLRRYANTKKRVVFLGMNPGPFGMAQTGVPFGEIKAIRDWLGIEAPIRQPQNVHPKRPIQGFDCPRREISGQRLWLLFSDRFGTAEKFFASHFVLNYCPLAFMEESGCNRTPNKLPPNEREPLFAACDQHLREVIDVLEPEWVIGVGDFAFKRARETFSSALPRVGRILHPSPASPAANSNWAALVTEELRKLGVWE
jgi:single-strand selective monofunctional uracil DNA glycosylase